MYKILRFILCYAVSLVVMYVCGFEFLVSDLSESIAVTTFFLLTLIPTVISFLLLEFYLSCRRKIERLNKRIEALEEKINGRS